MSDQILNFEEYRRRREEDDEEVRCAHCGRWIPAIVTRCPQCGVHFAGEAQDFVHPSEQATRRLAPPLWFVCVALLLAVIMVLVTLVGR